MRLKRVLMFLALVPGDTPEESLAEQLLFTPTKYPISILGGDLLINARQARFVEGNHSQISEIDLRRRLWKYIGNFFKVEEMLAAWVQAARGQCSVVPSELDIYDIDPLDGFWARVTGTVLGFEYGEFEIDPKTGEITQLLPPDVYVNAEIIEFEIDPLRKYTFVDQLNFDGDSK